MKQAIRYLDYVCVPSGIKIEANYPLGSQYLNIEIALLSGGNNEGTLERANDLGIKNLFFGVKNKSET